MIRPSTSVPPPGANGTTMVTGRVGQSCAAAGPKVQPMANKLATATANARLEIIVFLATSGPAFSYE